MGSSKKVYNRILRPAIMYDLETVALTGRQEAQLEIFLVTDKNGQD